MDLYHRRVLLIGGFLLFLLLLIFNILFSIFVSKMVDKQYEQGNFKVGEICYLGYKPHSRKSTGAYTSIDSYYFLVDGLKSQNFVRPYFPFKKQFPNFIKKMDRTKCYKAEYLEVNIFFYKQRGIYQLIDFNDFILRVYDEPSITSK